MDKLDDLLQKIKKEEKETRDLQGEFKGLSPKLKTLSNERRLVERWRDHAEAWLKTSKKLLQRQRQLTGEVDETSRSEVSKSVREAIKSYAEATKALTMIPPNREKVNPSIIDYFDKEYPGILQSFLEKNKEFEPLRQAYFKFELKPENVEKWEEKLQLASLWKNISSRLLEEWKKTTEDENSGVIKDYLRQLILPSLQEADTAVMDTVEALKAFQMVIEEEEKSLVQELKSSKKALLAADSNIGRVFFQDEEVGEDSQKKKRVASTTVDALKKGKEQHQEDQQNGYQDLKKKWLRSKQLYQESDFQNKTLQERMRIIVELFNNASIFLQKIDRQKDGQLYTQVENSRKTAGQVYETLKVEVKDDDEEDDEEDEQEEDEKALLQSFGPSSLGWYVVMMVLFIL
jgi:hypothetical protein